jgi:hypothetical protein
VRGYEQASPDRVTSLPAYLPALPPLP